MRKAVVIIILMIILSLLLPLFSSAEKNTSLDQYVPFGITFSEEGQYIPVFDAAGSGKKTDLLFSDQLCALDTYTIQGKYCWYHIIYLDDAGEIQTGYIKESNFEQLTISTLAEASTDPEKKKTIDQLIAFTDSSAPFTEASVETTKKQPYVLNTNTKKFHYPDCRSVKQIKPKNRKDYTGTREEIINMGFVPCKNCNP